MIYRFDEFEVDDREFRLSSGGAPVQLEPKVLRLLLCLIENRNRLVRKQELLDMVWPDAAVTENALTRTIGLLRKALNDDSHLPRFLETVPTAGYRFIAKVTVVEDNTIALEPIATPKPASTAATNVTKRRVRMRWMIACGTLLLAAVGTGVFLFVRHHKPVPTEKTLVILGDFENSTGEPMFDDTLRQGLEMQFNRPPFTTMSDGHIKTMLRMMGQPANARLTPAIAREICVRTSSAVVLVGSIAPIGAQYALGLRAMDCRSGKIIVQEQVQATRKEDVLGALDRVAISSKPRIRESVAKVEDRDTPLYEVTTPSIEALTFYSMGRTELYAGRNAAASLFLSRAVELDPDFSSAYTLIALIDSNRQEPERAAEAIRQAYALRDKVNEGERVVCEANYYVLATGELERAEQILQMVKGRAPKAPQPRNNLAGIYLRLGDPQKATDEASEAMRLEPTNPLYRQNLAAAYVSLNRFNDAEALYKEAEARAQVTEGDARARYLLAFFNGRRVADDSLCFVYRRKPSRRIRNARRTGRDRSLVRKAERRT